MKSLSYKTRIERRLGSDVVQNRLDESSKRFLTGFDDIGLTSCHECFRFTSCIASVFILHEEYMWSFYQRNDVGRLPIFQQKSCANPHIFRKIRSDAISRQKIHDSIRESSEIRFIVVSRSELTIRLGNLMIFVGLACGISYFGDQIRKSDFLSKKL